MSIRLDEMTIDEVNGYYKTIFSSSLSDDEFNKVSNIYTEKYNEAVHYDHIGYKTSGGMGRGFKYTKNILYGWYIEELFYILLNKNKFVKSVEYSGNDADHMLIFDHTNKLIKIAGDKTTNPDFLITLKDDRQFFIELKTAAAGVFSIKQGNVNQLYKTMGFTEIYSVVLMVDIVNGLYDIKDINYFTTLHPFVNNRMEGQLCYEMPEPKKPFAEIVNEDFLMNYNPAIFNNHNVLKYKLFKESNDIDSTIAKIIKTKIAYESKIEEFEFQKAEHEKEMQKYISKCPQILTMSWDDISKLITTKKDKWFSLIFFVLGWFCYAACGRVRLALNQSVSFKSVPLFAQ